VVFPEPVLLDRQDFKIESFRLVVTITVLVQPGHVVHSVQRVCVLDAKNTPPGFEDSVVHSLGLLATPLRPICIRQETQRKQGISVIWS